MKAEDIGKFVPTPVGERDPIEWSVPIGAKPQHGPHHQKREVVAFETCCEYLRIHPSVNDPTCWNVTHTLTGYAAARHLPSMKAARFVAGALSNLFQWSKRHAPYYKRRLAELPAPVREWILKLRRP